MNTLDRFKTVVAQTSDAPLGLEISNAEGFIYIQHRGNDLSISYLGLR